MLFIIDDLISLATGRRLFGKGETKTHYEDGASKSRHEYKHNQSAPTIHNHIHMQPSVHARCSIRAREIWENNGKPIGRDEEFWLQAERELYPWHRQ